MKFISLSYCGPVSVVVNQGIREKVQLPTLFRKNSLVLLQSLGSCKKVSLNNQIKYGKVLKKNLVSS